MPSRGPRHPYQLYFVIALVTSYTGCGDDGGGVTTPGPTTSTLQITATTSGSSPDPDGYTVTVDGAQRGILASTGSLTLSGLAPGDHAVGLGGIAATCQVQGDNPRTVTVPEGGSATVAFAVTCMTPPPAVGSVVVTTITTGPNQDTDGYLVSLDGNPGAPVPTNGSITLNDVLPGSHIVTLDGVAENCAVDANPLQIAVAAGSSAPVEFRITCSPNEPAPPSASRSSVEVAPSSIPVGETSTITVVVRDAAGNRLSGVSVSVSSDGTGNEITPQSATSNAEGVATFSFSSTVGESKTITAVAGGVTLNETEVITVLRASSTTVITSHDPNPSDPGETITVTFTVTGNGGRGAPTGEVSIFSLEEAAGCTVPVSAGSCTFELTEPGIHQLNATYSGDPQFEESFAEPVEHEVTSPVGATAAR